MAPALTETAAGQSHKFALTMSPPLPGIDQISSRNNSNHTPSSYLLAAPNDKHSNNKNISVIFTKQRQRRRVNNNNNNGRVHAAASQPQRLLSCGDRLGPPPSARKRPACAGGVIYKDNEQQLNRQQQGPSVNGKAEEEEEEVECVKPQSCTMNGKSNVVDGAKCVNKDLETNKKTMGTLKTNSAVAATTAGYINSALDTNGNKDLYDSLDTMMEDDVISTHSRVVESHDDDTGSSSCEAAAHERSIATKTDPTSGGPGPPNDKQLTLPVNLRNGLSCHRLVSDKTESRLRFQTNLERRTDSLLRRVYKLQTNHAAQHVSRQMMELIGAQRKSLQMPARNDRTSLLRLKLMSSTSAPSSSTLVDMKERILQSESMKNLSTAALVNLVRKLESSGNDVGAGSNFAGSPRQLLQQQTSASAATTTNCVRRYNVGRTNAIVVSSAPAPALTETTGSVKLEPNVCDDIEWTSGNLLTNLHHLEKAMDSDATASSSGGESCDEMDEVEEKRAKFIPFYKRAAWKWAVDRAGVISRWTWLQAQVSDLEYRIRQTGEIYRQLRVMKEPLLDEKATGNCSSGEESPSQVNGFVSGTRPQQLNGGTGGSSRTCPLRTIRKRKLLKMSGLPQMSRKAARLCSVQCSCTGFSRICNICCGRVNHVHTINVENMDLPERMGHLDPSFHPVLSFKQDIPLAYHFEAILSGGEQGRFGGKQRKSRSTSQINDHARKQSRKLKKNATATLTTRFRKKITNKRVAANRRRNAGHSRLRKSLNSKDNRQRNASESSGMSSKAGSPVPSPGGIENSSSQASGNSSGWSGDKDINKKGSMFHELMRRRRGESAFDIDNIVIPYSMAASTRVERLQYKEIITPKWRLAEDIPKDSNSQLNPKEELLEEDTSEESCIRRHDRCEIDEKKRFTNYKMHPNINRRSRSVRSDSRADSSGANTPDPLSPHNMVEHHDFPLITPPSTPAPIGGEDIHTAGGSSSSSRRRTTSLSKRDRMTDDFRVPTPDLLMEPVPPWDTRTFPLGDEVYEAMLEDMVVHEPPIVEETIEHRTNEESSEPFKPVWNEVADVSVLEPEVAIPPEPCDDPDWVPSVKTAAAVEGEQKSSRHSIVLKLAKR